MTMFKLHQRIRVSHPEHPAFGATGTIVRLRRADDDAWVDMDDPLPPDLLAFPADDPRGKHMRLSPWDCEAL